MEKITLTLKDSKKKNFFMELLRQLDFVEVQKESKKKDDSYNFFASSGLWKSRKIDAVQLKAQAWKRVH